MEYGEFKLGFFYEIWFLVRTKDMTESNFKRAMDSLRELPRSRIDQYEPEDPSAPLFTTGSFDSPIIGGVDTYGFTATTPYDYDERFRPPPGLDALILSIHQATATEPDNMETILEAMKRIFVAMNAIYAILATEFDFERVSSVKDLRKVLSGAYLLSDELVEAVGRQRLDSLCETGPLTGGLWLRFGEAFVYGIPKEKHNATRKVLNDIWSKLPILSTEEKRPKISKKDLPYNSLGTDGSFPFMLVFVPDEFQSQESVGDFFRSFPNVEEFRYSHEPGKVLRDHHSLTKRFLDGKRIDLAVSVPLDDSGRISATSHISMQILSGTKKEKSFGPEFERPGLTAIHVNFYVFSREHHRDYHTAMLQILTAVAKSFHPLFGFGSQSGSYIFGSDVLKKKPPERQLWPRNIYDASAYDETLRGNVRAFWRQNILRWCMRTIDERYIVLLCNDIQLEPIKIGPEAASQVLGEGLDIVAQRLPPASRKKRLPSPRPGATQGTVMVEGLDDTGGG